MTTFNDAKVEYFFETTKYFQKILINLFCNLLYSIFIVCLSYIYGIFILYLWYIYPMFIVYLWYVIGKERISYELRVEN